MFTLEQVYCFNQVFVTGSYSQAGKALGKTRTTVREHIVAMEDSTGLSLFEVKGKRLEPTQQAVALYERATYLGKHAHDLREIILALHDSPLSELVICHDPLVPMQLIHKINREMVGQYPHVQVKFLDRLRETAFEDIKQGRAHIALMASENLLTTSKELDFINLGTLCFDAYITSRHPLAQRESVSVNDLRLVKQYMTESASFGGLGGYPISVNKQVVTNVNLLLEMVSEDGWSILPEWLSAPLVEQKVLVRLQLDEILQSQPHNVCAFFPIYYRSHPQMQGIAEIVRRISSQCFD